MEQSNALVVDQGDGALVRGGSGEMFDRIAARYDFLNRVLSMGIDKRWRRKTIAALGVNEGYRLLDLATGTGDLAIAAARRGATVVGLDPSTGMLDVGRVKIGKRGLDERIEMVEGDAQNLPFESDSFDGVSMAFGIRNVPDRRKALREMARVTRPGGRVAILELSEPEGGFLAALSRFHIRQVVPRLGALLASAPEYRYLQKSIAAFPPAREFAEIIGEEGLEMLELRPLTFGVTSLYVATPNADALDNAPKALTAGKEER
ncbi:MAG: bifunctional demethylmenaquinone methyltransferase/2-methoxy-6-polyprenyl-1,4-benzoquinol methylase UbiE [Myxococcota bacterium]